MKNLLRTKTMSEVVGFNIKSMNLVKASSFQTISLVEESKLLNMTPVDQMRGPDFNVDIITVECFDDATIRTISVAEYAERIEEYLWIHFKICLRIERKAGDKLYHTVLVYPTGIVNLESGGNNDQGLDSCVGASSSKDKSIIKAANSFFVTRKVKRHDGTWTV